jgi:tRNA(His) guanylyltransferase
MTEQLSKHQDPFNMANSRFEYVKAFEQSDKLLQNTWIVVRIDGRGFTM